MPRRTATITTGPKNWTLTPFSVSDFGNLVRLQKECGELQQANALTTESVQEYMENPGRLVHAPIARVMPDVTIDDVRAFAPSEIEEAITKIIEISGPPSHPKPRRWN